MLRKLILVGVIVGSSASVPLLYQADPARFQRLLKPAPAAEEPVAAPQRPKPTQSVSLSGRKVRVSSDGRGHFVGTFRINGRPIEAMVDTGATLVAINAATARRIGIDLTPNDFQYAVNTANGEARAASVTIDTLQIGRIAVDDVQAVVLEDKALKDTLIGMSFLRRLGRFTVESGELVLQQ